MSITIKLGTHVVTSPVLGASGCFGFGKEFDELYGIENIGGLSLKSATMYSRLGNPMPRIAEVKGGMLNAIGLQNPGCKTIVNDELSHLTNKNTFVLANIAGSTIEEYVEVAKIMQEAKEVDVLEINISCPNVKCGGLQFGSDPESAKNVVRAIKEIAIKPVYVKLSPNVTDIVSMAKAVEEAGADGLVMINTLVGMRIDVKKKKPILGNVIGGMSGACIKPVAIRMIYQVYPHVKIPIIGVGGITTRDDVLEMMMAGASAVQVGSANFVNPWVCFELTNDLKAWCNKHHTTLESIIGAAHQ